MGVVLTDLSQAQAIIDDLQAKLAIANKPRKLTLKVSEKGAVSVYGMGKFPVSLYQTQWTRLLDAGDEIRAFIEANQATLKTKD